jgi:hypothetical protein
MKRVAAGRPRPPVSARAPLAELRPAQPALARHQPGAPLLGVDREVCCAREVGAGKRLPVTQGTGRW